MSIADELRQQHQERIAICDRFLHLNHMRAAKEESERILQALDAEYERGH